MDLKTFQLGAIIVGLFMFICYIVMLWNGNDDGAFGALFVIIAVISVLFVTIEGRHDGKDNPES